MKTDNTFVGEFSSYWRSSKSSYLLKWRSERVTIRRPCSSCEEGIANLITELNDWGMFETIVAFYRCEKCRFEFSTTEIDEINMKPVLKRKRKINNIVETIKSILKLKQKTNG